MTFLRAKPLDLFKPVTIDAELVKQLESDLRRMTKIYKDIPTEQKRTSEGDLDPEDQTRTMNFFNEAKRLFKNFNDNLEGLVSQVLNEPREEEEKNWTASALRKYAWSFMHELRLDNLFPTQWDYRTDKYIPAPWTLKAKRDNNIRRYQKAARPFFEALNDWTDYMTRVGQPTTKPATIEKTTIAGIPVVIHNTEREEWANDELEDFIRHLDVAKAKLKRAGFEKAYEGMTLHVAFDKESRKGLTAGRYNPATDELWVYPLGMSRDSSTFIHEVGHRFYFKRLGNNAKHEWERIIGERFVKITPEAVDLLIAEMRKHPDIQSGFGLTSREALALVEKMDIPEEMAAQLRYLADHQPYKKDIDELRQWHLSENVGTQVATEHITDYGDTNAWEAFAEAFKLYVSKGPGAVGPWTRQFFKEISRTGGAQVRSSMDRAQRLQVATALRAAANRLTSR